MYKYANIGNQLKFTDTIKYYQLSQEFESQSVNKKHKELRNKASAMEFAKRINSIREIEPFGQLPKGKQKQNRFTIENIHMILEEIEKSKLRTRDTILATELYLYRFPTPS